MNMMRPTAAMFAMGPEYEIRRGGTSVATTQGLPTKDGNEIKLPFDTQVQVGDALVGTVSKEEFVVDRVTPEVSGTTVLYIQVHRQIEKRDDHSRTRVTQNFGVVHGSVAGRDSHGDVIINVTVGDVLNYMKGEIEKAASPAEKKTLLAKLEELTKHPIVVNLTSTLVSQLTKGPAGMT